MAKKFSFLSVILYLTLILSSCSAYNDSITDIKDTIVDITVQYENVSKKCMGIAVYADGYILSTAHSFIDTYQGNYISSYCNINNAKYALEVIVTDKQNDLVLLKCTYQFTRTALFNNNSSYAKNRLYLATDNIKSHPPYEVTILNTSQIIEYSNYSRELISISANACYGDSGAPLIDNKGNIIGILCAKLSSDNNTYFAVKSTTITKFLESV